jgi:hypothetical protein
VPTAISIAERWVGTVGRECLDHLVIVGRPHRSLAFAAPLPSERGEARSAANVGQLRRRDVLGGLIHEYKWAA